MSGQTSLEEDFLPIGFPIHPGRIWNSWIKTSDSEAFLRPRLNCNNWFVWHQTSVIVLVPLLTLERASFRCVCKHWNQMLNHSMLNVYKHCHYNKLQQSLFNVQRCYVAVSTLDPLCTPLTFGQRHRKSKLWGVKFTHPPSAFEWPRCFY